MKNKRIVFVRDYYFPMDTPDVVRIGNLIKYFAEFGHSVDLFAVCNSRADKQDITRFDFPDSVRIHLSQLCKLAWLCDKILRRLYRIIGFVDKHQGQYFLTTYLAWIVKRTVKDAAVLVVSYPYSGSFPVIKKLALSLGVPYVIDFRDLPDEFDPGHNKPEIREIFHAINPYILDASFAVTVSPPLVEALKNRYGCHKVFLSTNGYEGELNIPDRPAIGDEDGFIMLFTGCLAYGRHLAIQMLLMGLRKLKDGGCSLNGVKVVVAGPKLPQEFREFVRTFEQDNLFEYRGNLSRTDALAMQAKAPILLSLSSPEVPGIMTSKIFEYVKTGHLIVNLPSRSDIVAEFLSKSGCGLSLSSEADVVSQLGPIIQRWRERNEYPSVTPNYEYLQLFSRKKQAKLFSEAIDSLVECSHVVSEQALMVQAK